MDIAISSLFSHLHAPISFHLFQISPQCSERQRFLIFSAFIAFVAIEMLMTRLPSNMLAADCSISPLALFWNIIYSVFTIKFWIFEVPPTLTHSAPCPRHQVIICHNKPTWHVRIYLVKVVSCPTFLKPCMDSFDQCAQVIHKMARASFHPTAHSSGGKVARYSCQGIQKELSKRHFYRGEAMQRWLANSPEETLVPGLFPEVPCDEGHQFYWTGVRSTYPCH